MTGKAKQTCVNCGVTKKVERLVADACSGKVHMCSTEVVRRVSELHYRCDVCTINPHYQKNGNYWEMGQDSQPDTKGR